MNRLATWLIFGALGRLAAPFAPSPYFILVSVIGLGACAPSVPANWARGGARLDVPRARWVVGNSVVELLPDGRVMMNNDLQMSVDRGGRVYDTSDDPAALLEPDGRVVGPGEKLLGNIGILHAARPDEANAWLSVLPTGEVVRYGENGERDSLGVWIGCTQSYLTHQTCTLVSHLLAPKIIAAQQSMQSMYPGYGNMGPGTSMPGMGVGFPPFR
jgi:hypothetical protein